MGTAADVVDGQPPQRKNHWRVRIAGVLTADAIFRVRVGASCRSSMAVVDFADPWSSAIDWI